MTVCGAWFLVSDFVGDSITEERSAVQGPPEAIVAVNLGWSAAFEGGLPLGGGCN